MKNSKAYFHLMTWSILSLFLICSCSNQSSKDFIIKEKDLVPEGLAYNSKTNTIYIGSTYKRKIVQINSNGKIEDFISAEEHGIWSPVGMEVDESSGILWVNTAHANAVMPLINPEEGKDWMTSVAAFDLENKQIIGNYKLDSIGSFLNDLTILPNGDVITTESVNNRIYILDHEDKSFSMFWQTDEFHFLNGIAYYEKDKSIFVSSSEGIIKIDLETKQHKLLEANEDINHKGIDGLTLNNNTLIGHQSTKVSIFYLDEFGEKIMRSEVLDTGSQFDSSTTGELGGGHYFFIVNSQIRSAIDPDTKTIKPIDSLENVIVRKIKL